METASQASSNLNVLALLFLFAMSLTLSCARRQSAIIAVLVTAAFVPLGQQFLVSGLHFYFLRILILVGLARLLMRHETVGFKFMLMDKLFVYWVLAGLICGILRGPSAETFGEAYDSLGIYFLIRLLTREPEDVLAHLRALAYVAIVMAVCMSWETLSHRNLFHVLGGVPQFPSERFERFRAQGPFRHSILAGTFGATLFPMLVGLWFQRGRFKRIAVAGATASAVITIASASSGPLMCLLTSLLGLGLWRFRERMSLFRRTVLAIIFGLALVMNAPVWFLIGRLSELTGGTGWYRSFIIDAAIKHFGDWWLIGSSRTAHWSPWDTNILSADPNNMDITNHYVVQGLKGGMVGLCVFIAILVSCFSTIGRAVRSETDSALAKKLLWSFGVALASHCMAFISVSYFDQIKVFWFWLLACIVVITKLAMPAVPEALPALAGAAQPERPPLQ